MGYAIEERTLGFILEDKAKRFMDKEFFFFEEEVYSYKEANEYANRVANGYASLGVRKGDKVTVMLPNCAEFIFNWFGLAKLGAVECPINIAYKGDLLRHVILTCDTGQVMNNVIVCGISELMSTLKAISRFGIILTNTELSLMH